MAGARDFRKYSVWQEAVDYATFVYEATNKMPWFEKKGLCDQLQRAAVSISSNIAEGAARNSDADFAHFLDFALGSAFEVETQLTIAKNVGYIRSENDSIDLDNNLNLDDDVNKQNANLNDDVNKKGVVTYEELLSRLQSIERQLNGLINSIRKG
jgi:four helix bundle protein